MGDDIKPELEVERLQSMHETVERLRSQLKNLQLASEQRGEPRSGSELETADLPGVAERGT